MKSNARKVFLIAIGMCMGFSIQDVNAGAPDAVGKPAELFFAAPPPEFKSAGSRVDGDALIQNEMDKAVLSAFRNGDVKYLESTSASLWQSKALSPAGYLRLGLFFDAITNAAHDESTGERKLDPQLWSTALETATNWSKLYPRSPFAPVALAELRMTRAWSLRGQGYAKDVPKEQWARFYKEVSKAAEILESSAPFAKANPIWYGSYVEIAKFSSVDQKDYMAIIEESIKTHPEFLAIVVYGVDYMLPRWGGSDEDVRNYIKRVTSLVRSEDAAIVYARLYRRLLRHGFYDSEGITKLAGANLARLKHDSQEIVRKFPDPYNEDAEAAMLCGIGDKEGLRRTLKIIGDSPILKAWSTDGNANYFLSCRQYAS